MAVVGKGNPLQNYYFFPTWNVSLDKNTEKQTLEGWSSTKKWNFMHLNDLLMPVSIFFIAI